MNYVWIDSSRLTRFDIEKYNVCIERKKEIFKCHITTKTNKKQSVTHRLCNLYNSPELDQFDH